MKTTIHSYKALTLQKGSYVSVQKFSIDDQDYNIHYWWLKQSVDYQVTTFSITCPGCPQENVISIEHTPKFVQNTHTTTACLYGNCFRHETEQKVGLWNFVSLSVQYDQLTNYMAELYINTKSQTFTLQRISYSQ